MNEKGKKIHLRRLPPPFPITDEDVHAKNMAPLPFMEIMSRPQRDRIDAFAF
jgi:hypothetical protein